MRAQRAFFAILIGGLVLTLPTVSMAQVDSRRIEEVVKKSVPAKSQDLNMKALEAGHEFARTHSAG